jgi:hypothetical protein
MIRWRKEYSIVEPGVNFLKRLDRGGMAPERLEMGTSGDESRAAAHRCFGDTWSRNEGAAKGTCRLDSPVDNREVNVYTLNRSSREINTKRTSKRIPLSALG